MTRNGSHETGLAATTVRLHEWDGGNGECEGGRSGVEEARSSMASEATML